MNSFDHPKVSATASTPRTPNAQSADQSTLADVLGASLSQRFESSAPRAASAELGYGCVDWFIYGAETRSTPAPLIG